MKKLFILFVLIFSLSINIKSQEKTELTYTMERNYFMGEEESEIFNFILKLENNKYNLIMCHFLPYKIGEYGYKEEIGVVPEKSTMLIKFSDEEVIKLNCINVEHPYYGLSDYSFRLMSFTNLTNEIIEKLTNKDVIKIRISTNIKYIDLKTNIFKYIKNGVNSLNNQKNIKNNSNLYDGF